jgi:hypothetical protein
MLSHRFWPFLALLLAAAAGCSSGDTWTEKRPKVVPVTGTVLYNGKPLANATVTFTNSSAGRSAFANTDANGNFTLTTFNPGDGAVPGHQQVAIRKTETLPTKAPATDASESLNLPPTPDERWLIPKHYGKVETSGLTAEVSDSGKNAIVLELKD